MGEYREYDARQYREFDVTEGILTLVVGGAYGFPGPDRIYYAGGARDVQDLHARIVKAVVGREEVGVSCEEDEEEELVGAKGNAGRVLGNTKAEQ